MCKRLLMVFLSSLAAASFAHANVFKCTNDDGSIVYQQVPCVGGTNEPLIRSRAPRETRQEWTLISQTDEMTDKQQCVIESPPSYAGQRGNDFLFVSIRVTTTEQGEHVVGIHGSAPLSRRDIPPSFHNNIQGLGIRVDREPFVTVDTKAGQRVLGFGLEKSGLLVSQLSKGSQAAVRVRFWPYDHTYDGTDIALLDFGRAMDALASCRGISDQR